jgi:hypothetical protein
MVFDVIKPMGKSRRLSREMTVIKAILLTIKTVIVAPNKICYNLSAGSACQRGFKGMRSG